jgi:hypothetical protein
MQRYSFFFIWLLLSGVGTLAAQSTDLSLAYQVVSGTRDTVEIYYVNQTSSDLELGAVNVSLVFPSSQATFEGIAYNRFQDQWGNSFFQRSEIQSEGTEYESASYDRRWQYGHSDFASGPVVLTLTDGQPTLMMKVVFERLGAGSVQPYLESLAENGFNQQSSAVGDEFEWDVVSLNAGSFPVEWLAFEASYAGSQTVALTWTTATENQNRAFQIERSENARDFVYLGEVDGRGNSSQNHDYHFLDRQATHDLYHYRLRQVDFDGSFSYSELRQVRLDGSLSGGVLMYPNPAQSWVRLDGLNQGETYQVEVLDLTGRSCQQLQAVVGLTGGLDLDVAALTDGLYTVQLTSLQGGKHLSRKLSRH